MPLDYPIFYHAPALGFDIHSVESHFAVRWHKPNADGSERWSVCHTTATGAILAALKNEDGRNPALEAYYNRMDGTGRPCFTGD